jgi:hypothetical protein
MQLHPRLAWIYRTYFTAEERSGLNFPVEARPYQYQAVDLLGLVAVSVIGGCHDSDLSVLSPVILPRIDPARLGRPAYSTLARRMTA